MDPLLNPSLEIEAKLLEQSAIAGKVPEGLALRALEDPLLASEQSSTPLSAEDWVADIREWASSHRRLLNEADDSRESTYAGRGD